MLHALLKERGLPPLTDKKNMLALLSEEYGKLPKLPDEITITNEEYPVPYWTCAHSLQLSHVVKKRVTARFDEKEFSFPVYVSIPNEGTNHPVLVGIATRREITDNDYPTEIVARRGFAIVSFCFEDIIADDNDFTSGVAGCFYPDGVRGDRDAGKLAIWAWAASLALDCALKLPTLDAERVTVFGHGRLGRSALLAAARDERFAAVFAACSGFGGASLHRGKTGEKIVDAFPRTEKLYAKSFAKYAGREETLPFDQHYLLASIAPRRVYIAAAEDDTWGDPLSASLACLAAKDAFPEGNIGFHTRKGNAVTSLSDFLPALDFLSGVDTPPPKRPSELLRERALPLLKTREEMLDILQREEYGYLPPSPEKISFSEMPFPGRAPHLAGQAVCKRVKIAMTLGGRDFSFPVNVIMPCAEGVYPFFVAPTFEKAPLNLYLPIADIIENGFAVLSFCYEDVTKDNSDFTDGLAGVIYADKERGESDPSKIALWAWACHRVLDYAETVDKLDMKGACVCGHSRLGKTALLAGATDPRFAFVHSNCSGYGGAASTGGVLGETNMPAVSRWFAYSYAKYECARTVDFDQHYLLALIAPRYLSVTSAYEDTWANPESEFLTALAATPAYEACGVKGLVTADVLPKPGDDLSDGNIRYAYRLGTHYFDRSDWLGLMQFVKEKRR